MYQDVSKLLSQTLGLSPQLCQITSPHHLPLCRVGSYHNSSSSNSLTFSSPATPNVSMDLLPLIQSDIEELYRNTYLFLLFFLSKPPPFSPSPLVKQMLIILSAGLTTSEMCTISGLLHLLLNS